MLPHWMVQGLGSNRQGIAKFSVRSFGSVCCRVYKLQYFGNTGDIRYRKDRSTHLSGQIASASGTCSYKQLAQEGAITDAVGSQMLPVSEKKKHFNTGCPWVQDRYCRHENTAATAPSALCSAARICATQTPCVKNCGLLNDINWRWSKQEVCTTLLGWL